MSNGEGSTHHPVMPDANGEAGEEVDVWSYASVLLRYWKLVVALPLLFGLVAGVRSLLTPREYTASARFLPQEPGPSQTGLGQLAAQFGLTTGRASTSSPQFYQALLQSREVLRDVVTTLYDAPGNRPFKGDLVQYFGVQLRDRDAAVAAAVERFRRILTVTANSSTGIVGFDVHTTIPALSEQIANRLLALVNDYNMRRRQSQARAEREFVEQRLVQSQRALTDAEEAVATFYKRNRRFSDSPELQAEEERLKRHVSLQQQVYLTLAQGREAAKIEEVRNTPVITTIEQPAGFVGPRARGTFGKVVIAFLGGGVLAGAIAFVGEYLRKTQLGGSPHFQEFVALRRSMATDFRRGLSRLGRR